jgi:hypothetical protein
MWTITKHYKIGLGALALGLLFVIVIAYVYFRGTLTVRGMSVSISNIKNGMTYSESTFALTGTTARVNMLYINGRQVLLSPDGSFRDVIAPLSGYNVLNVTAGNRWGKTKVLTYRFMYAPGVQAVLENTEGSGVLNS